MAREKLDALRRGQVGGRTGCTSRTCCMNLNGWQSYLHATFDQDEGDRIFSLVLEWDHIVRRLKSKMVSKIFNKIRRGKEIKLCQLLCTLCHRLKTFQNADTRSLSVTGPRITRSYLRTLLEEKWERYKARGHECAGFGEGCQMKASLDVLLLYIKDNHSIFNCELPYNLIFMLFFDWDHTDPTTKEDNVPCIENYDRRQLEIQKCELMCIFCHRLKSWVNKDYVTCGILPVDCQTLEEGDDVEDLTVDELESF